MDKYIVLESGKVYEHRSGGQYKCLDVMSEHDFILERIDDRWTMEAHGVYETEDGRIHWDYSAGGYFKCTHCDNVGSVGVSTSKDKLAFVCEDCYRDYGICDACGHARLNDELYHYNYGKGKYCENCYDHKGEE